MARRKQAGQRPVFLQVYHKLINTISRMSKRLKFGLYFVLLNGNRYISIPIKEIDNNMSKNTAGVISVSAISSVSVERLRD